MTVAPADAPDDAGRVPLEDEVEAARPSAVPAPEPPPPAIGVRSGRLEDLTTTRPAPVDIRIEPAGVRAAVVPVGVESGTGALAVPEDVSVAGWYRFGPAPGEPGSAVVTAHVDSASQGPGAFFPLRDVAPGAAVTVAFDDGSTRPFEVVGRRSYGKDALPVAELFTRDGDAVLTLVTCGGAFDPVTRSYEENLVVFAVPVGRP
jgi:hypothetical protein